MSTDTHDTFCRIGESLCGLEVRVTDGEQPTGIPVTVIRATGPRDPGDWSGLPAEETPPLPAR